MTDAKRETLKNKVAAAEARNEERESSFLRPRRRDRHRGEG